VPELLSLAIGLLVRTVVWRADSSGGHVIVRIWHGVTSAAKSDEYFDYLNVTGVPDYRATDGNQGVYVLRRIEGDRAHFLTVSFWESMEAIKGFAGSDPERAKYYPKDEEFLLDFEPTVDHYEILTGPRRPPGQGA
jgi:heme-degrading monooxygenase HmoA